MTKVVSLLKRLVVYCPLIGCEPARVALASDQQREEVGSKKVGSEDSFVKSSRIDESFGDFKAKQKKLRMWKTKVEFLLA